MQSHPSLFPTFAIYQMQNTETLRMEAYKESRVEKLGEHRTGGLLINRYRNTTAAMSNVHLNVSAAQFSGNYAQLLAVCLRAISQHLSQHQVIYIPKPFYFLHIHSICNQLVKLLIFQKIQPSQAAESEDQITSWFLVTVKTIGREHSDNSHHIELQLLVTPNDTLSLKQKNQIHPVQSDNTTQF